MRSKAWEGVECVIECCVTETYCLNMCRSHYNRYYAYGDPNVKLKHIRIDDGALARYNAKTERVEECLIWRGGGGGRHGYGTIRDDLGNDVLAHRWTYDYFVAPLTQGLFIDHICGNRRCVEPKHLREATPKQNAENITVLSTTNSSGHRGVSWNKRTKLWATYIGHNGSRLSFGYYPEYELHVAAFKVKEQRNKLYTHNELDRRV